MKYYIVGADSPTGFYIINRLILMGHECIGITIDDGKGDLYVHPDTHYIDGYDFLMDRTIPDADGIFYMVDSHRMIEFAEMTELLIDANVRLVTVMDWEIYNGVKRGNLPISTATPTRPETRRGVNKVWIKDTVDISSKKSRVKRTILVYPNSVSPLHLTGGIRIDSEYYLMQKIYEILEAFKTGDDVYVHKGDLKVIYDIIHTTDIAQAAIDLMYNGNKGIHMVSSNKTYTLKEIIEMLYGRLVSSSPISFNRTGVKSVNRRRSIENFDTHIDMVSLWSNAIYETEFNLESILDELIYTYLNIESENDIKDRVLLHLV